MSTATVVVSLPRPRPRFSAEEVVQPEPTPRSEPLRSDGPDPAVSGSRYTFYGLPLLSWVLRVSRNEGSITPD